MKKILYLVAGVAALLAVALATGILHLRSATIDYARDARLPGLSGAVEVWRDSLAVPHIWAASEPDLLRALGYVHAQERLWQMEMFRRVADGSLAEILGAGLVDSDRFLRTLGMGRAAALGEQRLDPATRALLEAYAAGVNTWIQDHAGALPPEFVALRFRPEPWTIRNSISVAKLMAWDLADWSVGLDLQRAVDAVGPELAAELAPRYPAWGATIIPGGGPDTVGPAPDVDAAAVIEESASPARPPMRRLGMALPSIPEPARELLEAGSISRASNSWVVDGSRTRSGRPLLANDPHLSLRAPSLWMIAALHGGETEVVGGTIPGIPGVVLGHTRGVSWGFTNAMVDDVDFFVETIDPEDPSRYLTPRGWAPLEVREDTILVKDADPVVHTVRATRNGPLLSDVEARAGDRVLSMRWTSAEPSSASAILEMNRAGTAEEFLMAIRGFDDPHQNVIFADTAGRIGYWMVGRVPIRKSGDGLLPGDGATGEHDWVGYVGFDRHPRLLDPEEGFIVTANNAQGAEGSAGRVGANFADPYRAMRIREMLEGARDLTPDEVAAQQMDVLDLHALRYLPRALAAARAAGLDDAASLLERWDARASADSRAAPVFYVWHETLRGMVGRDEFGDAPMYFPRQTLNRVLDAGGGAWVDDVRTPETETLDELSARAMERAMEIVAGRTWGELHSTRIAHTLGSSGLLDRGLKLNIGPMPNDGSGNTVNVAGYGGGPPFVNTFGASMRHVVDMGDTDGAGGFVIPTGQSGIPFSEHYRDQTGMWREGRLWNVPLARERAAARTVARMVLRP
jgi:penicillin amidase